MASVDMTAQWEENNVGEGTTQRILILRLSFPHQMVECCWIGSIAGSLLESMLSDDVTWQCFDIGLDCVCI
jgi:hypothetical protein